MAKAVKPIAEGRGGAAALGTENREGLSKEATFRQDERFKGSQVREEPCGARGEASVHEGQGGQRARGVTVWGI